MIEIKGLSFSYSHKKMLFDQLELELPAGNIYGLLGKNGAGKSTLLKIISGILFPNSGDLQVVGQLPKNRFPRFLQEVFIVNEEFELPSFTIGQFIRLYQSFYPRFSDSQMEGYLAEFKLDRKQKLHTLSYGQKKKFLLAFGLATDCKLLILDEPTNGLDIPSKSQFRKIVASAIHEERSFIISTHQVRDMENLIDPIIILDEGQVVFYETCERIAQKLTISRSAELHGGEEVIYAESSLGGYTTVRENKSGLESNLNLEVLFNAVINNKERMYQLFNDTTK